MTEIGNANEMLLLDEIDLLVQEYDPEQSDWGFRKGVIMDLIGKIRPLTIRAASRPAVEPVAWRVKNGLGHWYATADKGLADIWMKIEVLDVQPLFTLTNETGA